MWELKARARENLTPADVYFGARPPSEKPSYNDIACISRQSLRKPLKQLSEPADFAGRRLRPHSPMASLTHLVVKLVFAAPTSFFSAA